jgi:hypothetical protein
MYNCTVKSSAETFMALLPDLEPPSSRLETKDGKQSSKQGQIYKFFGITWNFLVWLRIAKRLKSSYFLLIKIFFPYNFKLRDAT